MAGGNGGVKWREPFRRKTLRMCRPLFPDIFENEVRTSCAAKYILRNR